MGADGGSVAKRSEIVRSDSLVSGPTKMESRDLNQWTECAMSGEKLSDPVVSDWNGNLYNKTAILEYLLGEAPANSKPKTAVSQIRDVVELQRDVKDGLWLDAVTRKELALEGMSEDFAYLAECGHIFPVRILSKSDSCPECEKVYESFTILNARTQSAKSSNLTRIEGLAKLGLSHSLRKLRSKTSKKRSLEGSDAGQKKTRRIMPTFE